MSKDRFDQYDADPDQNTDIGGIGIEGANNVQNFDNAFREHMAQHAELSNLDTIASASTTNIGSKAAQALTVTGTTTITSFGTVKEGTIKFLTFEDALTVTHDNTSLILPDAANITVAAGDTMILQSLGAGNWKCINYQTVTAAPDFSALKAELEATAWWLAVTQ